MLQCSALLGNKGTMFFPVHSNRATLGASFTTRFPTLARDVCFLQRPVNPTSAPIPTQTPLGSHCSRCRLSSRKRFRHARPVYVLHNSISYYRVGSSQVIYNTLESRRSVNDITSCNIFPM